MGRKGPGTMEGPGKYKRASERVKFGVGALENPEFFQIFRDFGDPRIRFARIKSPNPRKIIENLSKMPKF